MDVLFGNAEGAANDLLLNDGSGVFTSSATFAGGDADTRAVAFADVSGDGLLDVISGNWYDSSVLLLSITSAGFSSSAAFPGGSAATSTAAFADFNLDGRPGPSSTLCLTASSLHATPP